MTTSQKKKRKYKPAPPKIPTMKPVELKEWMKFHDFDKAALAELLGVTWQAVYHWLEGSRPIPVTTDRLLKLFDKDPDLVAEYASV